MTPKTLNSDETFKLLDELLRGFGGPKTKAKALRNYTMGVLMLDAGLRVGEVVQLRANDLWYLDEPVQSLLVRQSIAKNKQERVVPLSDRIHNAVKEMFKTFWKSFAGFNAEMAFYQTDKHKPLTTRQVERIIRAAAMKSLGRPIHPHVLRHTFATRMMRITNERVVQELLGHKSIASTQIYTHPNEDDKKEAIGQLNIGNNIRSVNKAGELRAANIPNSTNTSLADRHVR